MRSLGLLAVLAAAAAFAADAGSAPVGGCGDADLERPFLQFGDDDRYALLPEGDFESGTGWILTGGARVVAGNEPFAVAGTNHRRSLLLSPGTSATSRPLCLALALPSLRFFTRATPGGIMKVETIYQDASGVRRVAEFARFGASSSWWPTPPLCFLVNAAVPVTAGGTMVVSFRFTAVTGGWQIDDVYVDPRKGR